MMRNGNLNGADSMKRFVLYAVMLLVAASCSVDLPMEPEVEAPEKGKVVFHATFADPSEPATKAYLDETWKLKWSAGDAISVFNKNVENQQFTATVDATGKKAEFNPVSGDGTGSGTALSHVYAVYPYNNSTTVATDGTLSVTLPAKQVWPGNASFDPAANLMASVTDDDNLEFRNACGYLLLKLYGSGVSVSGVSLRGKNGEKLSGAATLTLGSDGTPSLAMGESAFENVSVACSTPASLGADADNYTSFLLVIPPTTFNDGFTITVTDEMGGVFEKTTSRSLTVGRNQIVPMAPVEVSMTYPVWGIVGSFNNWSSEGEVMMEQTSPGIWVSTAFNVTPTAPDFKIRKDHGWEVDYGGTFGTFGTPFLADKGGANLSISTTEEYTIQVTLNLTDISQPMITIVNIPVWGVVGGFNSWSYDLNMTETEPGIWVSPGFKTVDANGFKLRFGKSWEDNLGGSFTAFGNAIAGVKGGGNFMEGIEAGKDVWVKLDMTDSSNPIITIYEVIPVTVWSVIGAFNGWGGDLDMAESETSPGVWTSPVFTTNGGTNDGFKLRKNHDWNDVNYGGSFVAFGTAFSAESNGGNICVGESGQEYDVYVTLDLRDSSNPLITVTKVDTWSMIGSFSQWGEDADMEEIEPGIWRGYLNNIAAGTEFKFRHNHNWSNNLGAVTTDLNTYSYTIISGVSFVLVESGVNIRIESAGSYEVVLDLTGNTPAATVTLLP